MSPSRAGRRDLTRSPTSSHGVLYMDMRPEAAMLRVVP